MARPRFEVADVLRARGDAFMQAHPQPPHVCSALNLIRICRTAALDGHLDRCPQCGFERPSYNSCRNRHCPPKRSADNFRRKLGEARFTAR